MQQGRLSRATFPLRTEGLLDFSPQPSGGEQIVVTLIVTRTLLCDKIPAFYFHPTIKDPSWRLCNFVKLSAFVKRGTARLERRYISKHETLCTVRSNSRKMRRNSVIIRIQFPATACDNLTIRPGHGFTGLVLVFHHRDSGRLNTVSNSRSVADI